MAGIFGILGLQDTDRSFVSTIGQRAVYDATQVLLTQYNLDMAQALAVFVEGFTTDHTLRYKLPGGGRLQRRGGQAQSAAVKASGSWDVAFPLEDFGAQVAGDDVALAYMTIQEYNRHLQTVMIQDMNTMRFEILRRLYKNTTNTFIDPIWGSLTIQPLANLDAVVYPPVLGSESEATDDHYIETGYAGAAISDVNNPYVTIRGELEEHFGASTGGNNIVAFIHPDETAETEDLTDFDPVPDNWVRMGSNADVPINLPNVPGRIIGRTNGCWVSEWRWMTTGYMLGIDLEAPAPLMIRRDPDDTGLPQGLALVAEQDDYPIQSAHWRHRFGVGVANRLNGVVLELAAGAGYTIPAAYA